MRHDMKMEPSIMMAMKWTLAAVLWVDLVFSVKAVPDVRLVNGSHQSEGRVEIQVNETWGTICDHQFSNKAAEVICNSLGFPRDGAYAVKDAGFGQGDGPIFVEELNCKGNESSIVDCEAKPLGQVACSHRQDVGVVCHKVPLTGAQTTSLGFRRHFVFNQYVGEKLRGKRQSGWGPWKLVFGGVCGTRCKQKHEYLRDCQSSNCIGESSKLTETDCSGGKCATCNIECAHNGFVKQEICECDCPDFWAGKLCERCGIECHIGGTRNNQTCLCECFYYWHGVHCETCSFYCLNGGTVIEDSCMCKCPRYWSGDMCDRCSLQCKHGVIVQKTCECECEHDWFGEKCDKKTNETPKRMTGALGVEHIAIIVVSVAIIVVGLVICVIYKRRGRHTEDLVEDKGKTGTVYNYEESSSYDRH